MRVVTKSPRELTLRDRLSRLNFTQAKKLLGAKGDKLIHEGGRFDIDIDQQVVSSEDCFSLSLDGAVVTITSSPKARAALSWNCTCNEQYCLHLGAAIALILEEKMSLGLATPPDERSPVESLSENELIAQALAEREERAKAEKMTVRSTDASVLWTDYTVTSSLSGKTYRVALRGWERGESFCSCPDFRKNTLGTCKHILHVLRKVRGRFPARVRNTPFRQRELALHLVYGSEIELRLLVPKKLNDQVSKLIKPFAGKPIKDVTALLKQIRRIEQAGEEVRIYPDAEEFIAQHLFRQRVRSKMAAIRRDPTGHSLRKKLLKCELLPYQLDGIAFAVAAGRAVLADDMGLGKTIQGIGTAELFAREADVRKVLVICPASLKFQWRNEIERFSHRDCQLVAGTAAERRAQYFNGCFFTVCNYEQVLRDILAIEQAAWDLIILDEGQRIKNWEAKTSRVVKALKSRFALVLTGTPLENRLEELYSVVGFIDERRLGPAFRFFNQFRTVDERGKLLGYKNLDVLRRQLQPILLRRTRSMVMEQLPPRTSEVIRITATDEQADLHAAHKRVVASIIQKRYISEMDLLRLQKGLLMCRMAANSTGLVDKNLPGYSSKLERLDELLCDLAAEQGRKIVLFSEWTTMLNLSEDLLEKHKLPFVRLDGSIPQKKRQQLVHQFQSDPECKVFLTTNAGSTGLNLQSANTVINVDLPWNPAILEQRISRAHRMGQKNPVHVFILVTEGTIEENLLATLSAKHELSLAVLDPDSDATEVDLASGIEELKRRLEVLLGAQPEGPVDETMKAEEETRLQREVKERKERIEKASGHLISSAFAFMNEMIPETEQDPTSRRTVELLKDQFANCLERDENGNAKLTVTLPDSTAIDNLAESLARLMAAGQKPSSSSIHPTE